LPDLKINAADNTLNTQIREKNLPAGLERPDEPFNVLLFRSVMCPNKKPAEN
jgi:hypothetical protein